MLGGVATCWFSFGKSNAATLWQWLCWTATPPSTTLHGAAWPCAHWQRGSTASSGHYPVGPTPTHEKLLGSRVLCMPDQRTPFWPLSVTGPLFSAPPSYYSYSFCQTPLRGPHTCYVPRRRLSCSRSDCICARCSAGYHKFKTYPTFDSLTKFTRNFKYSFKTKSNSLE